MASKDEHARRTALRPATVTGAGSALGPVLNPVSAGATSPAGAATRPAAPVAAADRLPNGPVRVTRDGPRYPHLTTRGASNRFRAGPSRSTWSARRLKSSTPYGSRCGRVPASPSAAAGTASRRAPAYLAWIRGCYRDLFADTGGAPVPGEHADGTFIDHPDTDLADPRRNTSGTPWQTLSCEANHARLGAVKAQWDPRNVFHHALSVSAA
ncbi:BBE domain-containing protein [Streptomyces flavofungini]|uniref:BBE domain-containing protein n=1 Tax=Streptomyces flavofungini TaxID=68200 RepID=A0ABS0X8J9_9ACTN|nr:BBE domain-containing protein [Streptomyces flavofungini]MBJ3809406.1 BBE domain-containing protein [Streptomyces flavofungini]GHC78090.1 hypothetical protein GCM10010349_59190 [Streptomyces flavofungini]